MKFTLFLLVFILLSISSAVSEQAGIFKPGDKVVIQKELLAGAPTSTEVTCPVKPEGSQGCPLNAVFYIRYGQGVAAEEFPLRAGMTLHAAITRAGGMDGKVRKIKLLRGGNELIFDVRKLNPDGSNNPILMDGDTIIVPALSEKPAAVGLVKPGDSVFIKLLKPAEESHKLTTVYQVSDQGTLKLPLLKQEISTVGLSAATLARSIEKAYVEAGIFEAPSFTAVLSPLAQPDSKVVVIGCEVLGSGEFPLRKGMTLMDAIKRAGGFSEFAQPSRVKIIRADKELVYDLREIKPDGSNNPVLMDGDQIIVPADR